MGRRAGAASRGPRCDCGVSDYGRTGCRNSPRAGAGAGCGAGAPHRGAGAAIEAGRTADSACAARWWRAPSPRNTSAVVFYFGCPLPAMPSFPASDSSSSPARERTCFRTLRIVQSDAETRIHTRSPKDDRRIGGRSAVHPVRGSRSRSGKEPAGHGRHHAARGGCTAERLPGNTGPVLRDASPCRAGNTGPRVQAHTPRGTMVHQSLFPLGYGRTGTSGLHQRPPERPLRNP